MRSKPTTLRDIELEMLRKAEARELERLASGGEPPMHDGGVTDASFCNIERFSADTVSAGQDPAGGEVASDAKPGLSPVQLQAARMVAAGMTLLEIAQQLGVHRTTLYRWRRYDRAFGDEIERRAQELSGELTCVARRLLVKATHYVDRLMECDGSHSDWAARILRNSYLWKLAKQEE